MMTPKERVLVATARAQGVIMTMGALLHALNEVAQLWDYDPKAGEGDE